MKQIYNEGRVVGLSSYELYIRQLFAQDPTAKPMSEHQWLSANLSCNCSMILKIPGGTRAGVHDFILPVSSDLCGCSVIYASIFEGGPLFNPESNWAHGVNDYGRLVSNTKESHPVTPGFGPNVPTKEDPITITEEFAEQCRNYLKVTSALMFQPGKWSPIIGFTTWLTEDMHELTTELEETILVPVQVGDAEVGLEPDFSQRGFIRLAIEQDITQDFYILFNGFAYKTFENGSVGFHLMAGFSSPQDGDFLGPALFPWACKIVLVTTNEVMSVVLKEVKVDVYNIQATPPEDTGILWVDTSTGGTLKYFDGTEWQPCKFAWA